jgi:hypothetical protein
MHGYPRALRTPLVLETLESRENPNGTVTAVQVGTTLTLTGDDDNNVIQLKQVGGDITVTGTNTTITGGPTFSGVTSIRAFMRDGNDTVTTDTGSSFVLPGAASFDLGDGDNTLWLMTVQKLELGSLTVVAGDGYDNISVLGGSGQGSAIHGNASFSLGNGRNGTQPPGMDSIVAVRRVDVHGTGGLRFTSGEGDDLFTLENMTVTYAINASGGDGSLVATTTGLNAGSVFMSTVGREGGSTLRGTHLTATNTVVQRTLTLTANSAVNLEFTNGSTRGVTLTSGRYGYTIGEFHGAPTINGNYTARGQSHSLSIESGADVTITGDISMIGSKNATLYVSDGELAARNVMLSGALAADFQASNYSGGAATPGLTTTGALTLRGRRVQFDQFGGDVSVGGALSILAGENATVSSGQTYYSALPSPTVSVVGLALIQGRNVAYTQTESVATFSAGLTLQGSESATFESLPQELEGDPFNPPYGNGATTTVNGRGLLIRGREVLYRQVEGIASFATTLSLQGTEQASFEATPKYWGIDSGGNDVYGLGARTTLTGGSLSIQGRDAYYYQAEGEASFERGMNIIAREYARLEGDSEFIEVILGAKITVPNGGILVQGQDASLTLTDGELNVSGNVLVKGVEDAGLNIVTDDSVDGGKMTVDGDFRVESTSGDLIFDASGNFLNVAGDLTILSNGHLRSWLEASTGTQVGGNLTVTNAKPDHDWFQVEGPLTVLGDTSVSLGNGANLIEFGVEPGGVQLGGNLTLTTGNGSDTILIVETTVAGTTTINTGADRLQLLKDATFNGIVTVNFGSGADIFEAGLALLNAQGNEVLPAGTVTFNAAATVQMGTGNDVLRLGIAGDPDGKVAFGGTGSLTVDGQGNLNLFDDEAGQFDSAKVTVSNFIDPTP